VSAPLVVNTRDGVCWTRRTVTRGGVALYAPESVQTCPNFVMATLAELAEHGIAGSADVLPVPVGTAPLAPQGRQRTMLDHAREALTARMLKDDLRLVLENVITYAAERQDEAEQVQKQFVEAAARVAELVQERGERLKTEAALRDHIIARDAEIERLRARLAEFERPVDEDPIRYTLTEQAAFVGCDSCGTPDLCAPAGSCARLKQPRKDDVTPQVAKLRAILAGQREAQVGDR
jgi:hypothetical protein